VRLPSGWGRIRKSKGEGGDKGPQVSMSSERTMEKVRKKMPRRKTQGKDPAQNNKGCPWDECRIGRGEREGGKQIRTLL